MVDVCEGAGAVDEVGGVGEVGAAGTVDEGATGFTEVGVGRGVLGAWLSVVGTCVVGRCEDLG